MKAISILILGALAQATNAFAPSSTTVTTSTAAYESRTYSSSSSALNMANDDELMRRSRASRSAGIDGRVIELRRPLGLVLNEDASGNVYVETIAPKGNAARTGEVSEIAALEYRHRRSLLCSFSISICSSFCFGLFLYVSLFVGPRRRCSNHVFRYIR